jgi:hypothetical protein
MVQDIILGLTINHTMAVMVISILVLTIFHQILIQDTASLPALVHNIMTNLITEITNMSVLTLMNFSSLFD